MKPKEFQDLWNDIAVIEINKVADLCRLKRGLRIEPRGKIDDLKDDIYSRYETEEKNFRSKAGIKPSSNLDRHKVSAIFYDAFVYKTNKNEYSFMVFNNKNQRIHAMDAIVTHEIAFDIARGIMVSFIASEPKPSGYKDFVVKNGILEPNLICTSTHNTSYKDEVLKQIIYAQNENKLSIANLAIIFSAIENNTYNQYEISKKNKLLQVGRKNIKELSKNTTHPATAQTPRKP
ncbi:MAG: hypothetical protein LBC64_07995 [Fibromonadaceae bacterium]|jgi:hypothetical protein|nr:hypothetical protein [Fibromonadaceae bacterium]